MSMAEKTLELSEKTLQIREKQVIGMLANERRKIHGSMTIGWGLLILAGIAVWKGDALMALPLGLAGTAIVFLRLILEKIGKSASE